MKNLNILLATAMVFGSVAVSAKAVKKEVVKVVKNATTVVTKTSESKNFSGTMICDDKGRGLSLTVKNATNTVVLSLNPEQTTIKGFEFKLNAETLEETLVVKYRFSFKKAFKATKVTYALTSTTTKCKKCEKELNVAVGAIVKAKAFGFVPAAKK